MSLLKVWFSFLPWILGGRQGNGQCKTKQGKDCKFPFKWRNEVYKDCEDIDEKLGWCATNVRKDGSVGAYGFCDGKCTINNKLIKRAKPGSPCCRDDEKCLTADLNTDVIGASKIKFFNYKLRFVRQIPPNSYFYQDESGFKAILR